MAGGVVAGQAPIADRFSRSAERLFRALGDARTLLALLMLTGSTPLSPFCATARRWTRASSA